MSEYLDIIVLDRKIRANFTEEYEKLEKYENIFHELGKSLENKSLNPRKKKRLKDRYSFLESYIDNIKNNRDFNFYILKTVKFIEEYKKIIKEPVKVTFMGKPSKINKTKQQIIDNFLKIAKEFIKINDNINLIKKENTKIFCNNCNNKKDFDIVNTNIYICQKCYVQQTVFKHNSSYSDVNRINISQKYLYDRKIHFRDCINQYQGKQNCNIPNKIYRQLTREFKNHHLLLGNEDDPKELRFKNITKKHILVFLKELNFSNHYENVHLIHYVLTGIKPNDISHLESKLLDDFDTLTNCYDKKYKNINRKNFINTQYVLYQLLCRHKYRCKKEEFIILKTADRKFFHDEICKKLFETLGWNHTPFY